MRSAELRKKYFYNGPDLPVERMLSRRAFLAVREGYRAHTSGFVLQARNRGDDNPSIQIGLTVTRKVGNAVERNRIKRRLRALIRELAKDGDMPEKLAGFDIAILARRSLLDQPYQLICTEFKKALNHLVAKRSPKGQKRRNST